MSDTPAVMNASEVMALLGIKPTAWRARKLSGWTKQFEVSRPVGQRRYARVLVERHINGEPTNQYGRRRV